MNVPPRFAPYPEVRPPSYARWLAAGTTLLALLGAAGVFLRPFMAPEGTALLAAAALLMWLSVLLLRTLYYRVNRHNAQVYELEVAEVKRAWWMRYRQQAGLRQCLLLGAAGSTAAHWQQVLARQQRPPVPVKEGEGNALRLLSIFGSDSTEREAQLAHLLAMQWREQLPATLSEAPLACYWLGSISAWATFVAGISEYCPDLRLPAQAQAWLAQETLEAVIERLQDAPEHAWILCAGCRSLPAGKDSALPAGEAAVLWVLGRPDQGVRLGRGECYDVGTDALVDVAQQACSQRYLDAPPEMCVSFSQRDIPELSELDWRLSAHLQDVYWGDLGDLEAMVVQTLAALHVQHQGSPCGWLAKSSSRSLILGVVGASYESA